jgi:hypothetical protein
MWKLSPSQRLEHWRRLRDQISEANLEQALDICAQNWARAPEAAWYLDPEDVGSWPDPWTLIYDNYYCSLAKALGMLYTLHLSSHGTALDLSIRIYADPKNRIRHNLVWINQGKYVLNSADAWVLNNTHVPGDHKLLFDISSNELKLDRY